jgi:hypothetical protein
MCGLSGHTYNECLVFFEKPGVTGVLGKVLFFKKTFLAEHYFLGSRQSLIF